MPHLTPLIGTMVAGLVVAFLLGALAHRFKLPPIVGYVGSSRVDLQACKLEYSIVSPK